MTPVITQELLRRFDVAGPRTVDAGWLGAEVKLKVQALSLATLRELGCCEIGMDHFALPGDALAVAPREDRLRRDVIMALMCQRRVEFGRIAELHGVDLREHCAEAMRNLARLVDDGLVQLEPDAVQVTPLGWAFVRGVAMLFDEHLPASRKAQQARAAGQAAGGASRRVPVAEAAEEQVVQFSRTL